MKKQKRKHSGKLTSEKILKALILCNPRLLCLLPKLKNTLQKEISLSSNKVTLLGRFLLLSLKGTPSKKISIENPHSLAPLSPQSFPFLKLSSLEKCSVPLLSKVSSSS